MKGFAALAGGRTDDDDVAAPLWDEDARGGLAKIVNAVDVDAHGLFPLRVAEVGDGTVFRRPDTVVGDQHVEPSEVRQCLVNQALRFVRARHIGLHEQGRSARALDLIGYGPCGGLIGATVVIVGIQAIPSIGAANFSVAIIAGQLFGALLLDHFGWLGLPEHSISAPRLLGAAFLLLGVWLVQRY